MDFSGPSTGRVMSDSTVTQSDEDERAYIEISELDRLLGLPPPRFDLGAADIVPLSVLDSAENNSFDPEIEFAVPRKPQLLRMDFDYKNETETEVCFNKELSKVSVIKSELDIGADGQEMETECNSYLTEPVPVPASSAGTQDMMMYKRIPGQRGRGKSSGRGRGSLNRVVNKLLAKSETSDSDASLDPQCLQPANSICDNPIPKRTPSIPSPVLNKLKKLGTSVVVEKPQQPSSYTVNGESAAAPSECANSNKTKSDYISTGYLQIMKSLDKAVELTTDLSKKKKKRSPKKNSNNHVPSNLHLLAELENSDSLTKFSFKVDAKQVIELPEGQKLYTCDICSGVYHRGFSLKRHYLKTHINYKHICKRDLHNCGIIFDPSIEKGGARRKQLIKEDSPPVVTNLSPPNDIPDLYRCHTCLKCFMLISDLKAHLMEHPPVSVQNLAEDQFKNYTCPNCKARYHKKNLFLCHKETCGVEVPPPMPENVETHFCLFCDKTFPSLLLRKKHLLQMHHPKKKLHQCYLCKTKMFKERLGVIKHLILHHPDEYIGCLSCKIRFGTREEIKRHNKENHRPLGTAKRLLLQQKITAKNNSEVNSNETSSEQIDISNGNEDMIWKCTECTKTFASHLNMTRHRRLAHSQILRKKNKVLKKGILLSEKKPESSKTLTSFSLANTVPDPAPPTPTDPEVLFYSTITHNIRENLTHHLDGKLDSQEVLEYDLKKVSETRNKVLNFSASFTSESTSAVKPEAPVVPLLQKEPRSVPISPRTQWEKFSFPKNYDGRCGLTSYIKDMSHLDISTQLTMRRNLQRLNSSSGQESNKESPANIPAGLLLVEKPLPDCAETFGDPNEGKEKDGSDDTELSGEWVRPRNFLCAACGYKSTNLWDVEDHKYALHPNVWVPHIEIVGEQSSPWDWVYHRRLPPGTPVVRTAPAAPAEIPSCSKCGGEAASLPELHRHMLDCGGDTTWLATMLAVASPGARRRKWRPFGSRRRKPQGRRLLKRNIPNTPAKHVCGRIRTKPGDMDTIQKMIANLPAKRATRRPIGEEPDIKTRSQATISSVPISSVATYPSSVRSSGIKTNKFGKSGSKLYTQKKYSNDGFMPSNKIKNTEDLTDNIKEEPMEEELQPLEAENPVQHSDILTSLQMIPVVKKTIEPEPVEAMLEEPIDTSKVIAAMREAMLDSEEKSNNKNDNNKVSLKPAGKKKKSKVEDKNKKAESLSEVTIHDASNENVIMCNGCGMQFDNTSACQRHKKKCVYWKEEKGSERTKNNCKKCGVGFPYLMALLKHDCIKVETPDEPAMPELCPEKPVEEVHNNSVEDIPILSPVEVAREEVQSRRMSLLEATINEVVNESFDTSVYLGKNLSTSPKKSKENISNPSSETISFAATSATSDSEKNNRSSLPQENPKVNVEASVSSKRPSSPKTKLISIAKSNQGKARLRNKKVSDIFKEVKKQRRKRRGRFITKVGIKTATQKRVLRKNLLKKIDTNKRKKRSSNFIMLMKEWEKLEKEGAVAVGKRKRLLHSPETNFGLRQRHRRMTTLNIENYNYDTESLTNESLSNPEPLSQTTRRKRRQANSLPSATSSPADGHEGTEKLSVIQPENIKKEKSSCEETNSLNNEKLMVEGTNLEDTNENELVKNPANNKNKQENTGEVVKRKPGRPRFKSITVETEEHIHEAIDTIIQESHEKQDSINALPDQLLQPKHSKNNQQDVVSNEDALNSNTNFDWTNVNNIIYNVSIGCADVFKEEDSILSCNIELTSGSFSKKKRKVKSLENSSNPTETNEPNLSHENEEKLKNSVSNKEVLENDKKEVIESKTEKRVVDIPGKVDELTSDYKSNGNCVNKTSLQQSCKGKRKLSFSEEEVTSKISKRKDIKTKQLSIADYISISQFVNKTNKCVQTTNNENGNSSPQIVTAPEGEVNTISKSMSPVEHEKALKLKCAVSKETEINESKDRSKQSKIVSEKSKGEVQHKTSAEVSNDLSVDDNPGSPESVSSTEELALSVIREKFLKKKRKKLKKKKLIKKKQLELMDIKRVKFTPSKKAKDSKIVLKGKLNKKNKTIKVGVSRNRWEVSVIESKDKPVESLGQEETKQLQHSGVTCPEPSKTFYCAICDSKYDSSYLLYQHQLTPEHIKCAALAEAQSSGSKAVDESDPVKYCKSIGNIINDLEKRTLNVAKVMHQLKHRDGGESSAEGVLSAPELISSAKPVKEESWPQDWSLHCSTQNLSWEAQQQAWEVDSFSTGSSLGSIMDTVNKLLSSEQEVVAGPAYSWSDLQLAMGASDEEMAMLAQLGEHSLQEDYVYDNSRPGAEWLPNETASSSPPSLMDLDRQTSTSSNTLHALAADVKKTEPLSDSEDVKPCRSAMNRPRKMMMDYESKEMVCPTCNKHFLGLTALQTHVAWAHCAPVVNTSRLVSGMKRRALLNSDEVDRRLVCFVCKEIVPSASVLEAHIQAQHAKKSDEQDPKQPASECAEKLRSKMSLALGGLVDRALNKLIVVNKSLSDASSSHAYTSQAELNYGALQLLGRLSEARKKGVENQKSMAVPPRVNNELAQLVSRLRSRPPSSPRPGPVEVKPTNLLDHLAVCSSDVTQRPYACPICDLRFLIPSTRNRHIARAHGKYGRRYDQETVEDNKQDEYDSGWKDAAFDTGIEADDGEMLPLCSDCGLSFQSIQEVIQHRIEDHPRRFSAEKFQEEMNLDINNQSVVESSCETKEYQQTSTNSNVKQLPVSDNAVDSTSAVKTKKRRQLKKQKVLDKKKNIADKNTQKIEKKKKEKNNKIPDSTKDGTTSTPPGTSLVNTRVTESINQEADKISDGSSTRNSSEENLAELSKKLDRRKIRMGSMAEEAVRVKAEAALRELNLSRKVRSPSSTAKWGINSMKFTKNVSPNGSPSSPTTGSPSKTRFASLVDKKWKSPTALGMESQTTKTEMLDVNPDVYDFKDEDLDLNKKSLYELKGSPLAEHSEGNKPDQSNNLNATGSPKKTSQNKMISGS